MMSPMKAPAHLTLRAVLTGVFLLSLATVGGFARTTTMSTGRVMNHEIVARTADQMLPAGAWAARIEFSAADYVEVKREWIGGFMRRFRSELFRKNVPVNSARGGWQTRFNCTAFTDLFIGNAGTEMMTEQWQSGQSTARPAILALWYIPDNGPRESNGSPQRHCITLVLTDGGPVFVDPQVGEVKLSQNELRTIVHRRA